MSYKIYNLDYYDFWDLIEPMTISAIIIDPPYGENKKHKTDPNLSYDDSEVGFPEDPKKRGGGWFLRAFNCLSETGTLFIHMNTHKVWDLMKQIPIRPYDYITWDKRGSRSWSALRPRKNTCVQRTEVILGFPKSPSCREWHPTWKADVIRLLSNGVGQIDWHASPKSLNITKALISAVCTPNSDQLVIDPVAGSGTTGVAAKSVGLSSILNDSNPKYVEKMKWRLEQNPDPYFPNESITIKHNSLF